MTRTLVFCALMGPALLVWAGSELACAADTADCSKTYVIQPGGIKISARILNTEMSEQQIKSIEAAEEVRYDGFTYRRTGEPTTSKENCGGYVFRYLFPGQFKQGVLDADDFYNKFVRVFGSRRLNSVTAQPGDVVVYTYENGAPAHYALVVSNDRTGMVIRSKDNKESPYIGEIPRGPNFLTNDPLIRAYPGSVQFWHIDTGKITVEEVSEGKCDKDGEGTVYRNPTVRGIRVDRCLHFARGCDKPAADSFCKLMGHSEAVEWKWEYVYPTLILGDNKTCDSKGCGAFSVVRCK